ncbi:MAG: polysaccharide pyruvyl transferase family protein [Clostridiaceae bacterium]
MNNKLGIMTFHAAYNYGANLQAYALLKTVNQFSDAQILNFRPESQFMRDKKFNIKQISKVYLARKLYYLCNSKSIRKRNELFERFISEKLNAPLSDAVHEYELEEYSKNFDMILCGSDQIWGRSSKLYDRTMAYYINFPFHGKRASYAVSFGDNLDEVRNEEEELLPLLKKFDSISLREADAQRYLNGKGIEAKVNVDPTMLISQEEWSELAGSTPICDKPYVLYYTVNAREYSIKMANKTSEILNLPVISLTIHPKIVGKGFINKIEAGPIEFLNYLKFADFVVTNSFHGTIFSVIFEKPFVAVFDSKDGKLIREDRKANILEMLGLDSHMVKKESDIDIDFYKNYDFKYAKMKLETLKNDSINYLKSININE